MSASSVSANEIAKARMEALGFELASEPIPVSQGIWFLGTGPSPGELNLRAAHNVNAADTTNTDQIWSGGSSGLNLTGTGLTVGVWDGGRVLASHQEFGSRVTINDSAPATSDHATHVAGTIGAAGVNASARGMATAVNIRSYDWNSDLAELNAAASAIVASNHSYGFLTGWELFDLGFGTEDTWFGDRSLGVEAAPFGKYTADARDLDAVLASNPNLLSVWSAGNDRNDAFLNWRGNSTYVTFFPTAPAGGTSLGSGWYRVSTSLFPAPGSDGNNGAGFDSIEGNKNSKNNLTIGAVNDATADPIVSSSVGTTSFSSYGPTDDGRIKPDLVANGDGLTSPINSSNTAYASFSGTSMAAPNATGSATLLIQHYRNLFGSSPRSATTKAVLIHNATDVNLTGPDYATGWGLVDAARSAQFLTNARDGVGSYLAQTTFSGSAINLNVISPGSGPLKVTIAWTDPAGTAANSLIDSAHTALVNNLNLSVTGPGGTFLPWTLNPASPNSAAVRTTGNNVDNVEQVLIDSPSAGNYTITVSGPAAINQEFTILVSGAVAGTNAAPQLALTNTTTSLPENTTTTPALNVADVVVTDDGLGSNNITLTGADAAMFEVVAGKLRIRSGQVLDFETNPILDVTVNVDDPGVGSNPDDSESLSISLLNRPDLALTVPQFTNDTTPVVTVTVTDAGTGMPDGTAVVIDVDRNNDGDFADAGESATTSSQLTGGAATVEISPALTAGSRRIRARANDLSGAEGVSNVAATLIDVAPPNIITFISDVVGPRIYLIASDISSGVAPGTQVWFDVDLNNDGDFVDAGEVDYTITTLAPTGYHFLSPVLSEGRYRYQARVRDRAGNEDTSDPVPFAIDAVGPIVTVSTLPFTNDTTPSITVTATDAVAGMDSSETVWIDVDKNNDGDFADSGESNYDLDSLSNGARTFDLSPALAPGTYGIRARTDDSNGNEGFSAAVTVVVDTTAPGVFLLAPALTNDPTPSVTVAATDPGGSGVPDGTQVLLDVDLNNNGVFTDSGEQAYATSTLTSEMSTFSPTTPLAQGTYRFRARVADRAGNLGTSSTATVFLDTTAPIVLVSAPTSTMDDTPPITVLTAEAGSGLPNGTEVRLDVDLNNDGDFLDFQEASYKTSTLTAGEAAFDLTPALQPGTFRLRARTTDAAGNEGTSTAVQMIVENTPPSNLVLSNNLIAENTSTATRVPLGLLSAMDPNASTTLSFTLVTGVGSDDNTSFEISGSQLFVRQGVVLNHEAQANYAIRVRAADNHGGSAQQAFVVQVTNVNEAPVFTSPAAFSVTEEATAVSTVTAVDPDITGVTFSITGGADATRFSITETGALTFVAAPNFEVSTDADGDNIYLVNVQVTDGANYVTQNISITVTNVNEGAAVAVSGVAREYQTLTASVTDPDGTTNSVFAWQWERKAPGPGGGGPWLTIAGATSSTLLLTTADVFHQIRVTVSYTDSGGFAENLASDPTTPVENVNDPPQASDVSILADEDTPFSVPMSAFDFADPGDPTRNFLKAVKIVALPSAGLLSLGDTAVAAGEFVSEADLSAGLLTYAPPLHANGSNAASFTFQVQDDGGTDLGGVDLDPTANTITINLRPVNDEPQLDTSGSPELWTILEDAVDPQGTPLEMLLGDSITDPDVGAVQGIAVVRTTRNTWQVSFDAGTNWQNLGVVSESAAQLLPANGQTLIRLKPSANFNGTARLQYRAWDRSSGTTGEPVDLSQEGSTGLGTAFSAQVETAMVVVLPWNDAPKLDRTLDQVFPAINEDNQTAVGMLVRQLVSGEAVRDFDANSPKGIAVTLASTLGGQWQYTLNGGVEWRPLTTVGNHARLLPADLQTRIRFVPNPNYNGSSRIFYRAWDQSSGDAGMLYEINDVGDTTPFSSATEEATIEVRPVNDAPILRTPVQPVLNPIDEGQIDSPGMLVRDLIAGTVIEADDNDLQGVAVVDMNGKTLGRWEYTLDGENWRSLNTASHAAARLLPADDITRVRFVPANLHFFGTLTLNWRLWDQSQGIAGGTWDLTGGGKVGGGTAFSANKEVVKLTINNVNDAPSLANIFGNIGYQRGISSPVLLAAIGTVKDIDSPNFGGGQLITHVSQGADSAIRLGSGLVSGGNAVVGGTTIGTVTSNGIGTNDLVIDFNADATLARVEALLRSIRFSMVGGTAKTCKVEFTVTDGAGAASNTLTKTVNVT